MSNSDKPSKPLLFKLTKLSEIRENPTEMLEARPIVVNPDMVVLGGNMRLKACKAAGLTEAPVYIASWEESKAKEFIVKDNVGFGEWDWDILANEWDATELEEWGLDVWQPANEEPSDTDLSDKIEQLYRVEVVCTSEEEQEAAYNQITNLGYECRLLTL
jgi:ParB-like chromosome segregation protein Spo0J